MPKLLAIQVLRAAAALAVAVLHGQYEAGLLASASGAAFRPVGLLPWEAGVDVFFVISGFVMVFASQRLFGRAGARRVFLAHRVARVVPLYWLTTTLYLALALAAPGLLDGAVRRADYVLASYAFLPMARPDGSVLPLYSLGWTLNYEMFFYALFAAALGLSCRAAILAVSVALFCLVLAVQIGAAPQPLAFWGDPIVLEFVIGMGLGFARTRGLLLAPAARLALGLIGFALFAAFAAFAPAGPRALLFGLPAACLVAACALGRTQAADTPLARLGALLGNVSYALYLTHPFVIRGLRHIVQVLQAGVAMGPWSFLGLALLCSLLVSVAVYTFVERPLTAAIRRRLRPGAEPRLAARTS